MALRAGLSFHNVNFRNTGIGINRNNNFIFVLAIFHAKEEDLHKETRRTDDRSAFWINLDQDNTLRLWVAWGLKKLLMSIIPIIKHSQLHFRRDTTLLLCFKGRVGGSGVELYFSAPVLFQVLHLLLWSIQV